MNAKQLIVHPFPNIVMAKCKICGYKIKIQSVDNEPLKDYQLPSKCPCCGWQMEEEVKTNGPTE